MRIAVSNIAWDPEDDEQIAAVLLEAGVDAVEVAPTKTWPDPRNADLADARALRGRWQDRGFDIVSTQSLLFGRPELVMFGDDSQRDALVAHLGHVMALGGAMGARAQVFGSPKNRRRDGMPAQQAFEIAVDVFGRVAQHAEAAGTTLCLEANPPDYGADFMTNAYESAAVVQAVNRPGVRLHLDAACMQLAGDDPVQCVQRYSELLHHVHLSEPELAPVGVHPRAMHVALLTALRRAGYDDVVSVEMRPAPDPVPAVARAATYAADLLARIS